MPEYIDSLLVVYGNINLFGQMIEIFMRINFKDYSIYLQ